MIDVDKITVQCGNNAIDGAKKAIEKLTDQMLEYAANMEFEKAAETRDKIKELEKLF